MGVGGRVGWEQRQRRHVTVNRFQRGRSALTTEAYSPGRSRTVVLVDLIPRGATYIAAHPDPVGANGESRAEAPREASGRHPTSRACYFWITQSLVTDAGDPVVLIVKPFMSQM